MFILTFRQLKLATALSVVELLVQYFFLFYAPSNSRHIIVSVQS